YVVAFLLKTLSNSDGVFCFYMILEKAVSASRVSDGSGILLRSMQGFSSPQTSNRKRYSGQHGPEGNAKEIKLFILVVDFCLLIYINF
ncbi:hypothetical protein, partial [Flavobacterium tagetis]|uniref:hypothetical protein n=1 Tax=Flavobacterium tagetis TaxID=2801336 RepID=UPI001F39637C